MKILFATDFHGNEFAYRALFHTASRIDITGWRPEGCPKNIMLSDGGRIRLPSVAELAERPTIAEPRPVARCHH